MQDVYNAKKTKKHFTQDSTLGFFSKKNKKNNLSSLAFFYFRCFQSYPAQPPISTA
jgi:hypothetical protein